MRSGDSVIGMIFRTVRGHGIISYAIYKCIKYIVKEKNQVFFFDAKQNSAFLSIFPDQ